VIASARPPPPHATTLPPAFRRGRSRDVDDIDIKVADAPMYVLLI